MTLGKSVINWDKMVTNVDVVVQLPSCVQLFPTPWTAARHGDTMVKMYNYVISSPGKLAG